MASSSNLSTDITALIVEFYERTALQESEFQDGLLKYGVNGIIPEGNSDVIHWHRWTKFVLADDVAQGSAGDTSLTGISADATDIKAQLKEFGSFIKIPLFGDAIRLDSLITQSYKKFIEQASRTANRRLMTSLANGDTTGSNNFSSFTKKYAGGAANFGALTTQQITNKDVSAAVYFLRQNQAPGTIYAFMDPWLEADLFIDDADFRDLIKYQKLQALEDNEIGMWGGAKIVRQDEPWREDLATLGGAEGTYSGTGKVVGMFICSDVAYGKAQLMGKGGLKPKFHVQNISVTGSEMTIGYRIPFKGAVLNSNWGVVLRGVTRDSSVASVA